MKKNDNVPGIGKSRNSASSDNYDSLVLLLRNFDENIRIDTIQKLGDLRETRAVRPLLGRFQNDKSPKVRYYAVEELFKLRDSINDSSLWSILAEAMNEDNEEDEKVRAKIAEVLGFLNDSAFSNYLVTSLGDNSQIVWKAAAHSLGLIKDLDVIDELIEGLNEKSRHYSTDKDATPYITALIEMGPVVIRDVLFSIEDEELGIHESQNREYIPSVYYESHFNDRLEIISKIGIAALPEIKKILSTDDCYDSALFLISEALANIGGTDSLKILCSLTKDKHHEAIRWVSINGLKRIYNLNPEMVFQTLINVLEKDNVSEVQEEAIEGLAILKNSKATPLLGSILLDSGDSYLRLASAIALGDIMDPFALDMLGSALGTDRNEDVRIAAATALGKINNKSAIPYLDATTSDDMSIRVREAAKAALSNYK